MAINLDGNSLAEKVRVSYPEKNEKYFVYSFPIILEEYTETNGKYIISGVPYDYKNYYETRDASRFEYTLEKNKGDFDFSKVEWNDSFVISLSYRIDKGLRYYLEYSGCVFEKILNNISNREGYKGTKSCLIKRDLFKWEIKSFNPDLSVKQDFFNSYDKDSLKRSILNFFITDDLGVFKLGEFKNSSSQDDYADGRYQFTSEIVKDKNSSNDLSLLWVLEGISELYISNYNEYYENIDFQEYMNSLTEYWKGETKGSFLSCEISYKLISNLSSCNSGSCSSIKNSAFNYCKSIIETEKIKVDNSTAGSVIIMHLPSEILFYNRIVDSLGNKQKKYTESEIINYFNIAKSNIAQENNTLYSCYVLKDINEISMEYSGNPAYKDTQKTIYESLPDLNTFCDTLNKSEYCLSSMTNKLVCIDAISSIDKEYAKQLFYSIFYENYFESPISNKMPSLEELKRFRSIEENKEKKILDEYGYFVRREELVNDTGVDIVSKTSLLDSYYFIYVLSKLNNE